MQGPALLPDDLAYTESFETDEELLQALLQKPDDLVNFFETATADETWSEAHIKLLRALIRAGAKYFYLNRISLRQAQKMAAAIQEHLWLLKPFLYFRPALFQTVIFYVEKEPIQVNTLMFGVNSPYFSNLFRQACFDRFHGEVTLEGAKLQIFRSVEEHLLLGQVGELWRKEFPEVLEVMRQAKMWMIPKLVKECASVLHRYINRENVITTLLAAHQEMFAEWKEDCENFINKMEWGFRFLPGSEADLYVEILNFKEDTLERFALIAPWVTHLAFSGHLSESPYFDSVIQNCSRLIGIDLSGSSNYANQFKRLPESIGDFNLSACPWLNHKQLHELNVLFPKLKSLDLSSNIQLNFLAWAELGRFPELIALKLSNNNQITNEDLKLISRSCPRLIELSLEESHSFTDVGMAEVLENCPKLAILNLNYCYGLTDKTLVQLGLQAHQLTHLSIMRCSAMTDKGLLQLVRLRPTLRYLNVKYCEFSLGVLEKIRNTYSSLELID